MKEETANPGAGAAGIRAILLGVIALCLACGCAHGPVDGGDASADAVPVATGSEASRRDSGPRFEVASNVEGRVVSVRPDLRFAIVDFSFSRLPEPGSSMTVVREGKRVGKVRITTRPSQARGGAMVADIKQGEVLAGDLVKFE